MNTISSLSWSQGSLLWPRAPFKFLNPQTNRLISLQAGQSVWVCNSELEQQRTGVIKLARSGKSAGYAWAFSAADVVANFITGEETE